MARATTSRGASSARSSCAGMKRVPSGSSSRPPSPRTASVIRKDLASGWYRQVGMELDELHVRARGSRRARPWRCRRRWRCRGWWCTGRPCRRRRWPARCAAPKVTTSSVTFVKHVQAQAAVRVRGRPSQFAAGDQVDQRVVLEQRDVGVARALARSRCAARLRRWRRSRARCGAGCGRLRASGAADPWCLLPARTARPTGAARQWLRAHALQRNGLRPGRTGRRPRPGCRRTCSSKESPSASTAAMPPCAQALAPSLNCCLVTMATCLSGEANKAVARPAKPLPTMTKSNDRTGLFCNKSMCRQCDKMPAVYLFPDFILTR